MELTREHINKFKASVAFKTKATQETYSIFANKYLESYRNNMDRDSVIAFLSGFSKNSVLTAFYAIRFFFNSAEIPFDVKRSDISPSGVKKVKEIMSDEEVRDLIIGAKKYMGTIELGYLALSTTYGLRRIELYNTTADMIDIENRLYHVCKAKSKESDDRSMVIPEQIAEVLADMKLDLARVKKKPVITAMNFMFDYMCEKSGIELRPRLGFHCFVPDTKILIRDGYKDIVDIQNGDEVYDKDGELTKVVHKFENEYSGEMYKIKGQGLLELVITPNHPMFVAKVHSVYDSNLRKQNKNPIRKKVKSTSWKMPSELSLEDYLVVPKIKNEVVSDRYLFDINKYVKKYGRSKLQQFKPLSDTEELILNVLDGNSLSSFTAGDVANHIKFGKDYINVCLRRLCNLGLISLTNRVNGRNTTYSYNGGSRPIPKSCIPININTALFLGKYLADGSSSVGGVQIAFGQDELDEADCYERIVENEFGFKARLYGSNDKKSVIRGKETVGSGAVLTFGGHLFNRFLKDKFGNNAHNKRVPYEMMSCPDIEIVRHFIIGYINGDGYQRKQNRNGKQAHNFHCEISSVSKGLILQIQFLLTRLGIYSTIRNSNSDKTRFHILINEGNYKKLFNTGASVRATNSVVEDEDNFYYPIKSIIISNYSGYVYNFETESHTYLAHNIVTHNSIRRALVTQLNETSCRPMYIMDFMRWKERNPHIMQEYILFNPKKVDEEVFIYHPFLKYWSSNETIIKKVNNKSSIEEELPVDVKKEKVDMDAEIKKFYDNKRTGTIRG